MAAYMVVEIEVTDPVKYERYKELAPPSIARYGGKYLARGGKTETLEGTWSPKRLVILEFPSMDHARSWWTSKEYAEAKGLRQACAATDMVLLDGIARPQG